VADFCLNTLAFWFRERVRRTYLLVGPLLRDVVSLLPPQALYSDFRYAGRLWATSAWLLPAYTNTLFDRRHRQFPVLIVFTFLARYCMRELCNKSNEFWAEVMTSSFLSNGLPLTWEQVVIGSSSIGVKSSVFWRIELQTCYTYCMNYTKLKLSP
jgi:hypothetical protein